MKTIRTVAAAALIVATALALPVAQAQEGIRRTDLMKQDLRADPGSS